MIQTEVHKKLKSVTIIMVTEGGVGVYVGVAEVKALKRKTISSKQKIKT